MPIASAMTSRSCTGTKAAPNTGAAMKAAPGRIIATIHSQSCASTPAKPAGIIASAQESGRRSRW
jgi:hypothetical protein